MNILEQWKLINEEEDRTPAMKGHSESIIAFLEANPM